MNEAAIQLRRADPCRRNTPRETLHVQRLCVRERPGKFLLPAASVVDQSRSSLNIVSVHLCVLCVSVVGADHHRDTENTEISQRN